MNWRISGLDAFTLVSSSDAHSPWPWRMGREANIFDFDSLTYKNLIDAIRTRRHFASTIETPPAYGKYHVDGHRACNFSCAPEESRRLGNKCPKCGKELTIGVLNRVEQLADRKEGYRPKDAVDFVSLLPLHELIAALHGSEPHTKKVWDVYNLLIDRFSNEINVLLNVAQHDLEKVAGERLAALVIKNRKGAVRIEPGYDGVYGKLVLGDEERQKSLRGFSK